MKNKYFCWLFLLFTLVSLGASAQVKVEGSVFDEMDNPLIGVSVFTENRKTGAVTDVDGHFTITVPNTKVSLTFSYVGYTTQKIALKDRKLLKVVLKEDSELLDEVVVVGYGTQKKISVTGSIAQVGNKELKKAPSGTLSNMLAGRIPGLIAKQSSGQPGQDGSNLYIRGTGAGDGNALVVVDGVIQDYFPSFSPDEVESVTILKDATAAAVYGVRAAAGVILVTTKRGTVQKPTVTLNSSVTLSQNTNFPKFLNGPDYAYWYNKAQLMDGVAEENLRFSPEDIERINNPGENEEIYGNTDWFDLLFKNVAPTYTNTVSVSGGNERIKFFASLGAYNQEGIVETIEAEHIEHIIQPVKDLFGAIFFVSVGMLVNPTVLVEYAWPVIIITLVTIIGKTIFSSFGVLLSGEPLNTSIKSGFSLAQIGEFAFIIAGLGVSLKVLDPFISPIIVAVSVITTFTTPYFIRLANPFAEWLYKILPTKVQETLDRYASGKKTMNHDSDWKKLLKNMIGRVVIYSVLLTAIWLLSIQIIYPAISEMFTPITIWIKLVMCLGTLLLMTPFLWALISNKYNSSELFLKLWRDENYNHGRLVSLVLGRVSVALFFITSVVISYFKLNWGISVIIAIAVVALILILREDLTQYSRLETRFLANLNRREEVAKKRHPLKTSFNSEFNDKDLDLTSVVVSPYSDYISKSLGELSFRQHFGVNVVEITRGDLNIYIPKSSEHIYPQDKLTVVGTDTQLQEFRNRIEDVKSTSDTDAVDKKITLHSFTVDEEFRFLNQTIAQSHLGEKHDSIVVAIERNDELITLDKDTTFQLGDLVWIVGNREKIREILYLT